MHFPYILTTSCRISRGNTFEERRFPFFQLYFLFDEIALIRLYLFFPPASQVGSGGGSRPRLALVAFAFILYIIYVQY